MAQVERVPASQVTNLSADDPIAMLAADPDRFFGRTTKALDVTAEGDGRTPLRAEWRPLHRRGALALAAGAIAGICLGIVALAACSLVVLRRRYRRQGLCLYLVLLEDRH